MATRPIKIDLVGDDSQLKKTLKGASKKLGAFGQSVTKLGVTSAAAFGATACQGGVVGELQAAAGPCGSPGALRGRSTLPGGCGELADRLDFGQFVAQCPRFGQFSLSARTCGASAALPRRKGHGGHGGHGWRREA